jgi:rod shape-determining protein MreD
MMPQGLRSWWVITLTFLVAIMLSMMPLPGWAIALRPEWVALVLIYWCLAIPHRVGVGIGWLMGLMMDITSGALLGQYAVSYAVIAYIALKLYQRIRLYPRIQQALSVFFLLIIHQMLVLWIKGIIDQPVDLLTYWLPSVAGAILWPWLFILMRDIRLRFHVN